MTISTAVDASAVARVLGIKTVFKRRAGSVQYLPQRIALVGQGNTASIYSTTKLQHTSALSVANAYGYGSPLHLAAKQLFPVNGDGIGTIPLTVYPLDDDASGVAATGDVSITGTATEAGVLYVKINNIQSEAIVVASGDLGTALEDAITDAINAVLDMPVTAVADGVGNKSDLTSKWKGTSANDIFIEWVGTVAGLTLVVNQLSGGLVNPDVDLSLAQVGNVWETMILNCMDVADTASLTKYDTWGVGRWGALVRKPAIVFTGNTEAVVATAVTVPDARKTDYTNSQLVAPGSNDLPFVVAARQLARIAVVANNNPPHDYGSQAATGLTPGTDAQQWTYADRDVAVKAGSSTIEVKDGVINVSDVITFYHPAGDPLPAYRFVVDIVRLQNIIFNFDINFAVAEWDGAPLIPDGQQTTNRSAKFPKSAKALASTIVDNLALEAVLSDPGTTKENILVEIDSSNPKRLNMVVPVSLSGNTNIKSFDLEFGFHFGTAAIVA